METIEPTTADEPPFYRTPDDKVRPGDILQLAPHFQALKPPLVHVGAEQTKSERVHAEILGGTRGAAVTEAIRNGRKDTKFVVPGKFDYAVLLTRGCDIDNGKLRQLAAIRPLSTVQEVEAQAAVIEGRHTSLYYLPACAVDGTLLFDRSFVDFRYVVTMHDKVFAGLARPVSLSREAVYDLYFGWMRHTMGKEISQVIPCPRCNATVDVFAEIESTIVLDVDY
jgi:hypothetical protein